VGRKYFIFGFNRGDNFEEHAWKTRWEGVNREGAEDTPTEEQVVYNPQGERISRIRHKDAAIGLDTQDVHLSGDRVVITDEVPDGKGDIVAVGHRYSDSGKFIGSYEFYWEKVAENHQVLARRRRTFG